MSRDEQFMDDEGLAEAKVICRTCWAVVPWMWEGEHLEWHRNLEVRIES